MKKYSITTIIGVLVAACLLWIGYMEVRLIKGSFKTIIAMAKIIAGY